MRTRWPSCCGLGVPESDSPGRLAGDKPLKEVGGVMLFETTPRRGKPIWIAEELALLGLVVFSAATGHLWLIPLFLLGSVVTPIVAWVRRSRS